MSTAAATANTAAAGAGAGTTAPGVGSETAQKQATLSTGTVGMLFGLGLLPILFLIFFHSGAAYLSYQKYGSGLWAFIDFIFAYLYYPYYAFFLSSPPEQPTTVFGGRRGGFMKKLTKMFA